VTCFCAALMGSRVTEVRLSIERGSRDHAAPLGHGRATFGGCFGAVLTSEAATAVDQVRLQCPAGCPPSLEGDGRRPRTAAAAALDRVPSPVRRTAIAFPGADRREVHLEAHHPWQ